MFEHSTVCLLYVLQLLFEELNVFKPVTSKEGNSELYVIALKFNRTSRNQDFVNTLKHKIYIGYVDKF